MSSENQSIRKAWIRHARSLMLRKWLLAALGVALVAWAAAVVIHHRKASEIVAGSPAAVTPKVAAKTTAPPAPPQPKTAAAAPAKAPPAAAAATPPPAASAHQAVNEASPTMALRSTPPGEQALLLAPPPVQPPLQSPPASASPPSAPATQTVPPLPSVAVASPGFHVVPSDRDTKRLGAVTVTGPNKRTFTIVPAAPPPSSAPTAPAAVATVTPSRPGGFAPVVANPAVFSGRARATGPLTLEVQGQAVELFGVRLASPQDRCPAANGAPTSCAALAQAALARMLAGHSIVACRVPPGQRGALGAICLDEKGNDLGRFLVLEGLALADAAQSYDYLPAEGAARSAKRGLWRFR